MAISRKSIDIADIDTGEVDQVFMHIKKEVDKEKFVKLFTAQLQVMFDLSPKALKVFGYFMSIAPINKDLVYLEVDDCLKYTGVKTYQTINKGIIELLDKGLIARADRPQKYYLDPKTFFNGDRMVVVNEFWIEKSNKAMKDPGQVDLLTGKTNEEMKELQRTDPAKP